MTVMDDIDEIVEQLDPAGRLVIETSERDPRTDENGLVALAMPVAEFDAFVALLNKANIALQHEDGNVYHLSFQPHFIGSGIATLEISGEPADG